MDSKRRRELYENMVKLVKENYHVTLCRAAYLSMNDNERPRKGESPLYHLTEILRLRPFNADFSKPWYILTPSGQKKRLRILYNALDMIPEEV